MLIVQVTTLSGTGSRVNYRPVTPDPESNKALLVPFAAQLHITVQNGEQPWQWLLIRTKPPTLARKTHYLWPSDNQASIYHFTVQPPCPRACSEAGQLQLCTCNDHVHTHSATDTGLLAFCSCVTRQFVVVACMLSHLMSLRHASCFCCCPLVVLPCIACAVSHSPHAVHCVLHEACRLGATAPKRP